MTEEEIKSREIKKMTEEEIYKLIKDTTLLYRGLQEELDDIPLSANMLIELTKAAAILYKVEKHVE